MFTMVDIQARTQLTPATAAASIATVPVNEHWKVTSVDVIYSATATAGNREPMLLFTNADGSTIYSVAWNVLIAASTSAELVTVKSGTDRTLSLSANRKHVVTAMSEIMVPPSAQIQVFDWAAIAPGADTVLMAVMYERWMNAVPEQLPVSITQMPRGR